MTHVRKYRMLVQARTDLTPEEIAQYEASKGPNAVTPSVWPYRDTGDIIHARRRSIACAFYRALKQIAPIIQIRAVRLPVASPGLGSSYKPDTVAVRAWRGFECLCGVIAHAGVEAGDEVKHFAVDEGRTACGLRFTSYWKNGGKPECDKCLAVAVEQHPEMKEFL